MPYKVIFWCLIRYGNILVPYKVIFWCLINILVPYKVKAMFCGL